MTSLPLYSGNGKSYSLDYEESMHPADSTRCIADKGKVLTLYDNEPFYCRDIPNDQVADIVEIDATKPVVGETEE